MQANTIAAIATPWGRGGIGIIKISGPKSLEIIGGLFRLGKHASDQKTHTADIFNIPNRREIHYGHIVDPHDHTAVDEVLVTVMPKPNTYTREDVVEINAHAGAAVLRKILKLVLDQEARLARPGEFTLRAFMNGRVDLIQAEAVIDVINARTTGAWKIARRHLTGEMTTNVHAMRSNLFELLADIEAEIEFGEELENAPITLEKADKLLLDVAAKIQTLLERYDDFHIVRDGLKLVIVGKPNVGKSSLMNALIQNERALVTELPGTTRDLIRESINIAGIPVILTDTAGLHKSEDPIEKLGIEKTWQDLADADMVLLLLDGSRELEEVDHRIYEKIQQKSCLIVQNKSDLPENECFIKAYKKRAN